MTTSFRISQVAEQTGLSTSALRYYESIGLVKPTRTESGYRAFTDTDVQFLRFVARARNIGLSLDDVAELGRLWHERECSPVASTLRRLVADKATETEGRIAALTRFNIELQELRDSIDPTSSSGPCGDDCACNTVAPSRVRDTMRTFALVDPAPAPVACSLTGHELDARGDEWRVLLAQARSRTPIAEGFAFRFDPGRERAGQISSLMVAEQACCAFFDFTLRLTPSHTELTVRAPADAAPLLDQLFAEPIHETEVVA